MRKLKIWQCDRVCCSVFKPSKRRWLVGACKCHSFGQFESWDRAMQYARTEWSA